MFENEISDVLSIFDENKDFDFVTFDDILEQAKDEEKDFYNELENNHYWFNEYSKNNEIYAGSKELSIIKANITALSQKYNQYDYIINQCIGYLCYLDEDYNQSKSSFLSSEYYADAFYVCYNAFKNTKDKAYMEEAIKLAKQELEYECKDKYAESIDYAIFQYVLQQCIKDNDYTYIVSLINIVYNRPFKLKDDKIKDFYYCLIKIADVKSISLKFLQNKDFFSRENFQTVCNQIREELSVIKHVDNSIVISFGDLMKEAETLKSNNDFQGAEDKYREAITISKTSKERHDAFRNIYNMYKNIDCVRMLNIINEYFEKDVFENEFFKHYMKVQMLRGSNGLYSEVYQNSVLMVEKIPTCERKLYNWNKPVLLCMEIVHWFIEETMKIQDFNLAHSGCKLGLSLSKYIKENGNDMKHIERYMSYFSTKQTYCGKVKKDLAKRGNAKIVEPTPTTKSVEIPIAEDVDNTPMFVFNPNNILERVDSISLEEYKKYYEKIMEDGKNFNKEMLVKRISHLIEKVNISELIKSIYIQDNEYVGSPKQARSDIDFYTHSKFRVSPERKRDEYFSFVKIIKDVISKYGECPQYNITTLYKNIYIMKGLKTHCYCGLPEDKRRYFSNVVELLRLDIELAKKNGYSKAERVKESE